MRTAQEMRMFAERYKPDRLFCQSPKRVPFETIVENLKPNEDVLFCFVASAGTLGSYGISHVGIAITKDRILLAYKPNSAFPGLWGANCKTYNLAEINSVGCFGVMLEISVRAEGNIRLGNWSTERRNIFSSRIRDIVDMNQKKTETQHSGVSVADELMKFKTLFDQGIISREEFEAKKRELLG